MALGLWRVWNFYNPEADVPVWVEVPDIVGYHKWNAAFCDGASMIACVTDEIGYPPRYYDGSNWGTLSLPFYDSDGWTDDWARAVLDSPYIMLVNSTALFGLAYYDGLNWRTETPGGVVVVTNASMHEGNMVLLGALRVYYYNGGADTWTQVQPEGNVNRQWKSCDIHDSISSELIVGRDSASSSTNDGRLWYSANAGSTWAEQVPDTRLNSWPHALLDRAGVGWRFAVGIEHSGGDAHAYIYNGAAWLEPEIWSHNYFRITGPAMYNGKVLCGLNDLTAGTFHVMYFNGTNWLEVTPVVAAAVSATDWVTGMNDIHYIAGRYNGKLVYSD